MFLPFSSHLFAYKKKHHHQPYKTEFYIKPLHIHTHTHILKIGQNKRVSNKCIVKKPNYLVKNIKTHGFVYEQKKGIFNKKKELTIMKIQKKINKLNKLSFPKGANYIFL